ncbi:hypothetical protein NBRC116590_33250 [Pelagimonas sp. KU-00592-HH]
MRLLAAPLLLPTLLSAGEFPALFSVTGVAANDVLNIRETANASADKLGALAHNAENVEVVAVDDARKWALINTGETAGWVAFRYLARQSETGWAWDRIGLECFGTEPFWSAATDADRSLLAFQFFDDPVEHFAVQWTSHPENYTVGTLGLGAASPSGSAFATVRSALCSDGMSDRTYGLATELFILRDGTPTGYRGCCTLRP